MKRQVSFLSVALLSVFLMACKQEASTPLPYKPIVDVISISPSNSYSLPRQFVGMVRSNQQAQLGFEFNGKIESIYVDLGSIVKKGDKLAQLDVTLLKTEENQLQAQRDQLSAQIALVKSNLERQKQLKAKGFTADADIDSLISQRDALRANVRQVNAALASNQLRQEKSTLIAPYDGIINLRHVSIGNVIAAGAPVFSLLDTITKEAVFGVPVEQVAELENHAKNAIIFIANKPVRGTLLHQGAAINPQSRTVTLRYQLDNFHDAIDGQLAYIQQDIEINQPGFWVPVSALTDGIRGTWNLFVLVNKNHESIVERRAITVLYANEKRAFVNGEIKANEYVITDGLHRVVAGQAVTINKG